MKGVTSISDQRLHTDANIFCIYVIFFVMQEGFIKPQQNTTN